MFNSLFYPRQLCCNDDGYLSDQCTDRKVIFQTVGGSIGCVSGILSSYFPVTAIYHVISNALPRDSEGGTYLGFFLGLCLAFLSTYIGTVIGIYAGRPLEQCCNSDPAEPVRHASDYSYSTFPHHK